MCVDWYVQPVAAALFRSLPAVQSLFFAVRAVREGPASHTFFASPLASPTWPGPNLPIHDALERVCGRLFGSAHADLFDAATFSTAFRPCTRWDGAWTPFLLLRRAPHHRLHLEGMGTLHRKEEYWDPGFPLAVPNRTVDQVMEDLTLLDASAQILWRMEMAIEAWDALEKHPNENENLKWAVNYLDWVMASV